MSEWWQARSPRERLLLQMMLGLAAFVLGWLLVVRPLADALETAKARHGTAVVALAEAKARDEAWRRAGANAAAVPLPVDSLIAATANEAGFTAARVTAAGPARASVALDSARPQALFGWVATLERRGLVVERLRAQANADRTLTVEVALRARGG